MEFINNVILFVKKFWSIIWQWVTDTIVKHKLKNSIMLAIALAFFFLMEGAFWTHLGFATLYIWIGINVESILTAFKELKKRNNW